MLYVGCMCLYKFYLFSDPFYWAWLPMADEVFSEEIRDLVTPKLRSPGFVSSLQDELFDLFSVSLYKYDQWILNYEYPCRKTEGLIEGCSTGKCLF